jgi:hypothetical protein
MPASGSESIFVCYRRSDSADTVDRIYELLERGFSRRRLFRDVDSIPRGVHFPNHIAGVLKTCSVVLVVIGPGWLDARTEDGRLRLEDPSDHVRVEIETALRVEGMRVIPVLVRNASIPKSAQLPDSIQGLVERSGLSIRPNPDFRGDMSRLLRVLRESISEVRRIRSQQTSKTSSGRLGKARWPLTSVAWLVVLALILFVGAIWLAGAKLNHTDQKADSVTATPTPIPKLTPLEEWQLIERKRSESEKVSTPTVVSTPTPRLTPTPYRQATEMEQAEEEVLRREYAKAWMTLPASTRRLLHDAEIDFEVKTRTYDPAAKNDALKIRIKYFQDLATLGERGG